MMNWMFKYHPNELMVMGVQGEETGLGRRGASSSWMSQLDRLLQKRSSASPGTKKRQGGERLDVEVT